MQFSTSNQCKHLPISNTQHSTACKAASFCLSYVITDSVAISQITKWH